MNDWVLLGALCLFAFVFIGLIFVVADDHRRIRTLIEAHNALAKDFGQSMQFIKRFNTIIDEENANVEPKRNGG